MRRRLILATLAILFCIITVTVATAKEDSEDSKSPRETGRSQLQQVDNSKQPPRPNDKIITPGRADYFKRLEERADYEKKEYVDLIEKLNKAKETAQSEGAGKTIAIIDEIIDSQQAKIDEIDKRIDQRRKMLEEHLLRKMNDKKNNRQIQETTDAEKMRIQQEAEKLQQQN